MVSIKMFLLVETKFKNPDSIQKIAVRKKLILKYFEKPQKVATWTCATVASFKTPILWLRS